MTSLRCQGGLNGLNFFVGALQTAFGPFFTVYLTQQGWSQIDIGFALSVGTGSALLFQVPAGALVDAIHLKRLAVAVALLMTGLSAVLVVVTPTQVPVLTVAGAAGVRGVPAHAGDRRAHVEALRP